MTELKQARRAAEEASHHKSQFLANMSHEIRTPMTAIVGMSQLAMETQPGAEQRDYLRTVTQSATGLLSILNDILDLSKVEAGKLDLVETGFAVEEAVRQALAIFTIRAREKHLSLDCTVEPTVPPFVRGDEQRLRQILVNLAGNALKFTSIGGVNLRVKVEEPGKAAGPMLVRFTVGDTGIGVPADKQKRIFQPFVQADGSTTRRFGGTGLGLAISAELVRRMGGSIRIESPWLDPASANLVSGTAIHFTVLLTPAEAPEVQGQPSGGAALDLPARVLLAEDNAVNQKLFVRLLTKRGHTVDVVGDGLQAWRAWENGSYALILMDVQMPEMDGFEATARIRQGERKRGGHVPIVALTANALDGDRQRCIEAGMDDYITKPANVDDLYRVVSKWATPAAAQTPANQA
ncbi:MAG: response regulator [Acidobacteria bacterium]|nr:response regulator [Acidobacteriota bacterium]